MILPAKGHGTTEFYAGLLGALSLLHGAFAHYDASIYGGAAVLGAYVLSRGIAKAGFGRAAHR